MDSHSGLYHRLANWWSPTVEHQVSNKLVRRGFFSNIEFERLNIDTGAGSTAEAVELPESADVF